MNERPLKINAYRQNSSDLNADTMISATFIEFKIKKFYD